MGRRVVHATAPARRAEASSATGERDPQRVPTGRAGHAGRTSCEDPAVQIPVQLPQDVLRKAPLLGACGGHERLHVLDQGSVQEIALGLAATVDALASATGHEHAAMATLVPTRPARRPHAQSPIGRACALLSLPICPRTGLQPGPASGRGAPSLAEPVGTAAPPDCVAVRDGRWSQVRSACAAIRGDPAGALGGAQPAPPAGDLPVPGTSGDSLLPRRQRGRAAGAPRLLRQRRLLRHRRGAPASRPAAGLPTRRCRT